MALNRQQQIAKLAQHIRTNRLELEGARQPQRDQLVDRNGKMIGPEMNQPLDERGWGCQRQIGPDRGCLAISVAQAPVLAAKLDRVGRKAAQLLSLLDGAGVRVVAADDPDADWTSLAIKAVIAQHEGDAISRRTKEALRAAKARGQRLGNPNGAAALRRAAKGNGASVEAIKQGADEFAEGLRGTVAALKARGVATLKGLAVELNAAHIRTPRGGTWHPSSVRNLLARLETRGV